MKLVGHEGLERARNTSADQTLQAESGHLEDSHRQTTREDADEDEVHAIGRCVLSAWPDSDDSSSEEEEAQKRAQRRKAEKAYLAQARQELESSEEKPPHRYADDTPSSSSGKTGAEASQSAAAS